MKMVERMARRADFAFSEQPVRCASCGQFIGRLDAEAGRAKHYFEPDNHFGPEKSEWTCPRCAIAEAEAE